MEDQHLEIKPMRGLGHIRNYLSGISSNDLKHCVAIILHGTFKYVLLHLNV